MNTHPSLSEGHSTLPRVVVISLASCFGCQLQITNYESALLDLMGQIDMQYWQLTSSDPMPKDFDIALIEGAVTTEEAHAIVVAIRKQAKKIIAIGACANTGGLLGLAAKDFEGRAREVYQSLPDACGNIIAPRAVSEVIEVDYRVPCCPIDPLEFIAVLDGALYGSNRTVSTKTLCGDCKRKENDCFYGQKILCLGLVTQSGCGARCINLGQPCKGCRGLSPDANIQSAREAVVRYGISSERFDEALALFNQTNLIKVNEGNELL